MSSHRRSRTALLVPIALVLAAAFAVARIGREASPEMEREGSHVPPARRVARGETIPLCIRVRRQPVAVTPVAHMADTVSRQQLLKALEASLPWWHPPTVPSLIHELRLWGRKSDFPESMVGQARSGVLIVETLLNDALCRQRTTPNGASFLVDSPFGINVVLSGTADARENRAEGHYGQLLMVLAEAGVPADTPVTTASGRIGTVADVLQDALLRFARGREVEFVATALPLWIAPETTWTDQFDNRYTFDQLVDRLLAAPLGVGSCGGCHVPYAVVTILGVDRRHPLLSATVRSRALRWLVELSDLLTRTQLPDGGWDRTWTGTQEIDVIYNDSILDRITVTGHHLEWIALAPESVHVSRTVVERAVSACVADIDQLPPMSRRSFKTILPCSHAARAMCLLRHEDPFTVWMIHWSNQAAKRDGGENKSTSNVNWSDYSNIFWGGGRP